MTRLFSMAGRPPETSFSESGTSFGAVMDRATVAASGTPFMGLHSAAASQPQTAVTSDVQEQAQDPRAVMPGTGPETEQKSSPESPVSIPVRVRQDLLTALPVTREEQAGNDTAPEEAPEQFQAPAVNQNWFLRKQFTTSGPDHPLQLTPEAAVPVPETPGQTPADSAAPARHQGITEPVISQPATTPGNPAPELTAATPLTAGTDHPSAGSAHQPAVASGGPTGQQPQSPATISGNDQPHTPATGSGQQHITGVSPQPAPADGVPVAQQPPAQQPPVQQAQPFNDRLGTSAPPQQAPATEAVFTVPGQQGMTKPSQLPVVKGGQLPVVANTGPAPASAAAVPGDARDNPVSATITQATAAEPAARRNTPFVAVSSGPAAAAEPKTGTAAAPVPDTASAPMTPGTQPATSAVPTPAVTYQGSAALRGEIQSAAAPSTPRQGMEPVTPAAPRATLPVLVPESGAPAATPSTLVPQTPVSAPPGPAAAPPAAPLPAPAPVPVHTQLAAPLFSLARSSAGEHTMTLALTPEEFGPVTVRAVITNDGVKMEIFASTDAGRDALRSAMTDLRRDLAGQAMNASLDLSSRGQPDQQANSRDNAPARDQHSHRAPARDDARALPEQPAAPDRRMYTHGPTLDVMA